MSSARVSKTFGSVQSGKSILSISGSGANLISASPLARTVLVDNSAAVANVLLPKSASLGTQVTFVNLSAGNATVLNKTSGNVFVGTANSVTLSGIGNSASFTYIGTLGWALTHNVGATIA